MVPEWAPNVHPIIVHFPIALLILAVMADLLSLLWRQQWLQWAATGLYLVGAVAGLAAFVSGREAAESVLLPTAANRVLTDHADWALWTIWAYGVLALVRTVFVWRKQVLAIPIHLAFFCMGVAGMYFLYQTGDHGAQLVYQYGVGVAAVDQSGGSRHDHGDHSVSRAETGRKLEGKAHIADDNVRVVSDYEQLGGAMHMEAESIDKHQQLNDDLRVGTNGDWHWIIGPESPRVLREQFTWLQGDWLDLMPAIYRDGEKEKLLLHSSPEGVLFVREEAMADIQVDLRIRPVKFSGSLAIVHHVQDVDSYHFLEVKGQSLKLGKVYGGATEIFDEGVVAESTWMDIRLVSDGTHLRGYINGKMVVHGHAPQPAPGRVGLRLEGAGLVLLNALHVEQIQ